MVIISFQKSNFFNGIMKVQTFNESLFGDFKKESLSSAGSACRRDSDQPVEEVREAFVEIVSMDFLIGI